MSGEPINGALLSVDGVGVHYGAIRALQDVSLRLDDNGFVLVLGPNGAGKTTLLRALAGAVIPSEGTIRLRGRDVTRQPAHRRVRSGIALVPEGRGVLAGVDVRENLELAWHSCPAERRGARDAAIEEACALFPILGKRLELDCASLSGGEMQMLAIARALLARPSVLLLDEPSLGLAPRMVDRLYEALKALRRPGLGIVLVEQAVVPIHGAVTSSLVLRGGEIVHRHEGGLPSEDALAEIYLSATDEGWA